MAEFLTGFSNILWGAPVLILLGIVGLLYGIRTKFFQIRKMGYILKNTAFSQPNIDASAVCAAAREHGFSVTENDLSFKLEKIS